MGFLDFLRGLFGGSGEITATGWPERPRTKSHNLDELARRLGVSRMELEGFQPAYQEFEIAKRAGGKRRISAPSAELKTLQKKVLKRLLGRLKSHPAAHGFEKGRSIRTNAQPHAGRGAVVRMDLVDFFAQTRAERVALGHPTGQRFAHYRAQTVSAMNRHSNLTNTTRNRVEI